MARKVKVLIENGIDKREIGYYSTPKFIAKYLTDEMLNINKNGLYVLDPAVGKEELLSNFAAQGKVIDGFDVVRHKDTYEYCTFSQQNFIEYYAKLREESIFENNINTNYDYIIANPPYNCHEISYIKDNKAWLKNIFEVGVYNMYSMFLSAMINIAKEGCVIGVIISDSFLTSSAHSKLRSQIFNLCSIHQIILCPSDLFWNQKADVRTCILIIQKGKQYQHKVKISDRPKDSEQLKTILENKKFKEVNISSLHLNINKSINPILIDVDESIIDLFYKQPLLGELFKCVTCISTGNDSRYLSKDMKKGFTVPFYKNPASHKFYAKEDSYLIDDYMEESLKVKDFMVRNKHLIGMEGIACSSMGLPFSAVLLPQGSVSGVNPTIFPKNEDLYWLISYLNSSLVTYLIRGVLIRSNMVTSGYVNCLPILNLSDDVKHNLALISQNVLKRELNTEDAIEAIDNLIFSNSNLPINVVQRILAFSKNLGKSV